MCFVLLVYTLIQVFVCVLRCCDPCRTIPDTWCTISEPPLDLLEDAPWPWMSCLHMYVILKPIYSNPTRRPQEPLLFQGTVRENLDPSGEYSDAALWQALRSSRLADGHDRRAVVGDGGSSSVRQGGRGGNSGAIGAGWTNVAPGDLVASRDGCGSAGAGAARAGGGYFGLETELDGYGANMSVGETRLTAGC